MRSNRIIFPVLGRIFHSVDRSYATSRGLRRCGGALFLLGALVASGQNDPNNRRTRRLAPSSDTIVLDTLSIAPGSFTLSLGDSLLGPMSYALDPFRARLLVHEGLRSDTLVARYRVLPLLLGGAFQHKDADRLMSESARIDPFKYVAPAEREDLFGSTGLNKSGSVSRGVLFGNNQDLSVNSTLNLELSGRLTDRIQVLASITDNNIPIQADGNTLELQDFDQVFIKIFEDTGPDPTLTGSGSTARKPTGWELIAGDIVLQRPKSYFLTYLKKTKGLSFTLRSAMGEKAHNELGATIAISKGKFARNPIQGVEGVQGPYRLRGNDGENFIIVLSGTERVYIDGQLLTRGQENDYVIDYNTAELTFTARRLITKDRRIAVEFQYSDKNYTRSLVRLDETISMGRSTLRVNVYSEQDHKNQQLQQQLTDDEKIALSEAGDDPLAAVVPGIDSVAFTPDQVLYKRVDSLGYFPVFVNSTNEDSARFRLVFSNVGSGRGDYLQQSFTPNGRVYRWVAPDTVNGTIVQRGDHAPVRVLIAPRSQQVLALGFDHNTVGGLRTTSELAFSQYDLNTFSGKDEGDDQGFAARTRLDQALGISRNDSTWAIELALEGEGVTRTFKPAERYRPVEFERNWNALNVALDGDQLLAATSVGLRAGKAGRIRYAANTFQVRDRYSGWKHDLISDLHPGRLDLTGTASLLLTILPVAFVANIVRVMILVLVTYHFGDEAGQKFHDYAGYLEIVLAFGGFFLMDSLLVAVAKRLRAKPVHTQ